MSCEYKAGNEAANRCEVDSKTPKREEMKQDQKKTQRIVCCAGSCVVDCVRETKAEGNDHLGKVTHMAGTLDDPRSILHQGQEWLWGAWSRRSEPPLQVIHILWGIPGEGYVDLVSILGDHQTSRSACQRERSNAHYGGNLLAERALPRVRIAHNPGHHFGSFLP